MLQYSRFESLIQMTATSATILGFNGIGSWPTSEGIRRSMVIQSQNTNRIPLGLELISGHGWPITEYKSYPSET
jgi:hypothetical protein